MLPDSLRELAVIRLDNPDAPLSELALMLENPVSKSGIKHRLDKIVETADKLKENGEN
ncbi:MAG: hypothetical protein IK097_04485 [Clostridia bacterium]|nr:hypothetical protein [Clostridia bacterium]